MAATAFEKGYRVLYHWQSFNEERLTRTLKDLVIYCSSPEHFNDPWDCKPFFNTKILCDPEENEKHIEWAASICRRHSPMSESDIESMKDTLRGDPARAKDLVMKISRSFVAETLQRYRVYCLGPDVGNLLMWAHYADSHKGICLEFSLRNDVMCTALPCEYLEEFPVMKLYSHENADVLHMLLAKAEPWCYEKECRIIAQERKRAIGTDTLMTDDGFLKLSKGALVSVIVGCQGDFGKVNSLVQAHAPNVKVKRAVRVPNRYSLQIEE
ncbi:DUF2971 domain-containing protein [Uliginosibacterium gangwonense]|uniref:DUF2971 domain-containing protein n=1 Tax=Uliginosibacterium gangwonense TaxID=392736 RepID=UPI0003776CFD|nr:DUF2971 domain-containing protein [Uliginosibacterium gangwonense]